MLIAVPRIFNRIYDGVNQQMRDKPKPIQALFHAGIRAATRRSRGDQLSFGESLTLKLADKLIFKKVRQKFGGRLKLVVSGSAALSKEVAEFIDALGIDVYEGYGLTETAPVVSVQLRPATARSAPSASRSPTCGSSSTDQVTGDPKNGEIVVYGDNVMHGYHNRPEEDAKIFTADRGLRTGDMGYVDDDGYLYITGRIKEQYKLENGKYVVPSPLEEQLKLSPYIGNVMLYGANKPHNVALVVLNLVNLAKWAEREGVTLGDPTQQPAGARAHQGRARKAQQRLPRLRAAQELRAHHRRLHRRKRHAHAQDERAPQPGARTLPGHARRSCTSAQLGRASGVGRESRQSQLDTPWSGVWCGR